MYDDDRKPKTSKEEMDRMMKEFLEKGGKVQKLEPGYPIQIGSLDKSKKPQWTIEEIKECKAHGKTPRPDYKTYKKGTYHDYNVGGDNPPVYIRADKKEK